MDRDDQLRKDAITGEDATLRTTRTVLAAAALAVVVLTGCGQDPAQRTATVAGGEPAATAAAEAPEGNGETLTKKQVKAALLTVKDLPSGWSDDPEALGDGEDDDSTTKPARCQAVFAITDKNYDDPVADASATFSQGITILEHSVATFDDDTDRILTKTAKAFSECPRFTDIDPDGTKTKVRMSALSFPDLGDRTLAMRAKGTVEDMELVIDLIAISVGHNIVAITAGGLEPMPGDDLEAIARKAVAKLG
jgi:hypothetical protein